MNCVCACGKARLIVALREQRTNNMKRNRIVIDFDNKEAARAQPRRKSGGGIGRPLLILALVLLLIVSGLGAGGYFWWRHYQRDRKSTRLNSSHLGISYAVF